MKRLLLFVAAVLVAAAAFADAADRDVLITADGTVFAIGPEHSEDSLNTSLLLTVQAGGKTTQSVVPESNSGLNGLPSLAYDAESKKLFVVWMRTADRTSELLVASYLGGKWDPALIIDSKPVLRSNLSIRFTRQVLSLQRDGTYANVPALILHAAWWEKGTASEGARYAVMPLNGGWSITPDIHELSEFVDEPGVRKEMPATGDGFLRHVALVDGPTSNSVDAIFSDNRTSSFYRVTLRPSAEIRIHITVGVKGPKLGGPHTLSFDWSGKTGTIASPDGQTIIFTNTTDEKVSWLMFRNGKWFERQELALNERMTANAAMAALARMAASE